MTPEQMEQDFIYYRKLREYGVFRSIDHRNRPARQLTKLPDGGRGDRRN